MAIIPSTDKFFSHSENVNTTIGGPASAQEESHWYTMQDIVDTVGGGGGSTYKVFTALLTQTGGDNPDSISGNGGTLDKGYTYEIVTNPDNYDLTIYGAPNNNAGTSFICTVTVPTLPYTSSLELKVNYGAPVATVFENTIGNIWINYIAPGEYYINSNDLFTQDKVFTIVTNNRDWFDSGNLQTMTLTPQSESLIFVRTGYLDEHINDVLNNTPIEVRVYN